MVKYCNKKYQTSYVMKRREYMPKGLKNEREISREKKFCIIYNRLLLETTRHFLHPKRQNTQISSCRHLNCLFNFFSAVI
uniref:Uncharacterized protein n=1 Tax=Oryza brachyantha TaxID=4533 RepID=J3MC74_ORYBR